MQKLVPGYHALDDFRRGVDLTFDEIVFLSLDWDNLNTLYGDFGVMVRYAGLSHETHLYAALDTARAHWPRPALLGWLPASEFARRYRLSLDDLVIDLTGLVIRSEDKPLPKSKAFGPCVYFNLEATLSWELRREIGAVTSKGGRCHV